MAQPSLTVIVSCSRVDHQLRAFLHHIEATQPVDRIELFLIGWEGLDYSKFVTKQFASVTSITLPEDGSFSTAIVKAVQQASTDIIVTLEDHVRLGGKWVEIIPGYFRDPSVGGLGWTVKPFDTKSSQSWSGYLAEYGLWGPGIAAGSTVSVIPGHNTAYRRAFLLEAIELLDLYFLSQWFLNEHLVKIGRKLVFTPDIVLFHMGFLTWRNYLIACFCYGWCFANVRATVKNFTVFHRALYACAMALKPLIRWKVLIQNRRDGDFLPRGILLKYAPGTTLGFLSEAIGESLGYIFGMQHAQQWLAKYEIGFDRSNP